MRIAIGLVLLAAGLASRAEDAPAPTFHEYADKIGQPAVIVAPQYPPKALAEKRGAIVEVEGSVTPLGNLADVKIAPVPPADDTFADAVREVIGWWLFHPPTDEQCQPSAKRVVNRVEFSAADGKPHIQVLRVADPAAPAPAMYTALRRDPPRYPERAIQQGVEATVYVRVDVNEKGEVSKVFARAYSSRKAGAVVTMQNEVEYALRAWRFPPPDGGKPWAGCYVVNYRLRG